MRYFYQIALLFILSYTKAQVPQEISDSLTAILNSALPTNYNGSGLVLRVSVPGQWSWSGAAGYGISGNTAGQPQTVAQATDKFRVGSITKMMVATCILKMEQDGLLSLSDSIGKYLRPTLINDTIRSSSTVTIRQLLNHSSGIANLADNQSCQQNVLLNPNAAHSLEEAINCGASLGELFTPGTSWSYSNTNYSLLAMIIESISGISYRDYLYNTIINPLNLNNTEIPSGNQISVAHMGCYWNIGNWIDLTIINPTTYTGWADVVSTTEDLITFYQALQNGQLISFSQLNVMKTIDPQCNGYGMGLDFYNHFNTDCYGHYGEVANTSGLFFGATSSQLAPYGYYVSYNFNIQGADMIFKIDRPIMSLLKNTILGVNNNVKEVISIFPNPVKDQLCINFENQTFSRIELIDFLGRVTYAENISEKETNLLLNCENYPRGNYILRVSGKNKTVSNKIILN
jgi:CubicO group peptidase (beta-lactamase class C family)